MTRLIQLEWLKFRNHRAFRILMILYLIILPAIILLPKSFNGLPEDFGSLQSFYMFPNIYAFAGYIGSWLVFFLMGFLGVLLITTEFDHNTLRQNIITGLSRRQFLLAKFGFILLICLIITLYFIVISLTFGIFNTEAIYLSKVMEGIPYFLRYFLQAFAYILVGFMLGLFFKRTGLSLFLFFAYAMFIEPIIRWVFHKRFFDNESMNFYPFNAFEDLVPIPFSDQLESLTQEAGFNILLEPNAAVVISIIYLSLFSFLIYRKLKVMDL